MHQDNRITVLFLTPYPIDEPVTRFRIAQYFNYFRCQSVRPILRAFFPRFLYKIKNDAAFYKTPIKFVLIVFACFRRIVDLTFIRRCDVTYISKEVFPFGPAILEKIVKRLNYRLVFDFDDAIFAYPSRSWRDIWTCKQKVSQVISIAYAVIAGNEYLANYARKFSNKVTVVPTVIDTDKYVPKYQRNAQDIIIGWIGTWSNVKYLFLVRDVIDELAEGHRFVFKIVGPANIRDIRFKRARVVRKEWTLTDEVRDLQSFDIGIMPLIDSVWERGKCGFKIIQYMAVGIPAVASPVGVNTKVVENGVTGFIAENESEWYKKLALLLSNANLRHSMGVLARERAVRDYSVARAAPRLLKLIASAARDTKPVDDVHLGKKKVYSEQVSVENRTK